MVKVVLDTNSLLAARWNPKSSSQKILDLCIKGSVTPVYTKQIRDENLHILKKVKPPEQFMNTIRKYYRMGKLVRAGKKLNVSKDKSDNRFLEAAVAGKADYIISNDHHLLDITDYNGIQIIRPAAFIRMIP